MKKTNSKIGREVKEQIKLAKEGYDKTFLRQNIGDNRDDQNFYLRIKYPERLSHVLDLDATEKMPNGNLSSIFAYYFAILEVMLNAEFDKKVKLLFEKCYG